MNDDMKRLCDAAIAADSQDWTITRKDAEAIVRAVIEALQRPSDNAVSAMSDALSKPRLRPSHRASDDVRTALLGYHALLNHITQMEP